MLGKLGSGEREREGGEWLGAMSAACLSTFDILTEQ